MEPLLRTPGRQSSSQNQKTSSQAHSLAGISWLPPLELTSESSLTPKVKDEGNE